MSYYQRYKVPVTQVLVLRTTLAMRSALGEALHHGLGLNISGNADISENA
jgi:hypothetical protein